MEISTHEMNGLSPRECGITWGVSCGMSNKKISAMYGLSPETIKEHISRILQKTGQRDRLNLALWWFKYAVYGSETPSYKKATKRWKRKDTTIFGSRISDEEWDEILVRFGKKCLRCGTEKLITKDHVIPVSKGGRDVAENIQPLCLSCNSIKGQKSTDYRTGDDHENVLA